MSAALVDPDLQSRCPVQLDVSGWPVSACSRAEIDGETAGCLHFDLVYCQMHDSILMKTPQCLCLCLFLESKMAGAHAGPRACMAVASYMARSRIPQPQRNCWP